MHVTHVIRGDDHLSNTPRQILIYEALGLEAPTFAHLSMILGADGRGSQAPWRHERRGIRCARLFADTMVNFLALLGWSLDGEDHDHSSRCAVQKFGLDRITKKDAVFDETKSSIG